MLYININFQLVNKSIKETGIFAQIQFLFRTVNSETTSDKIVYP
jgi:hypothetical protein